MLTLLTRLEVHIREFSASRLDGDGGAGIVEYLLLVLFIALTLVLALGLFSGQLSSGFSRAANSIPA